MIFIKWHLNQDGQESSVCLVRSLYKSTLLLSFILKAISHKNNLLFHVFLSLLSKIYSFAPKTISTLPPFSILSHQFSIFLEELTIHTWWLTKAIFWWSLSFLSKLKARTSQHQSKQNQCSHLMARHCLLCRFVFLLFECWKMNERFHEPKNVQYSHS